MRALWLIALFLFWLPANAHALALMKISGISDFNLGNWSINDPAISAHIDICIYGIDFPTLLSYGITVSSSPSGYVLSNGSNTINYSLEWEDSGVGLLGEAGTQLSDGVKLSGRLNLNVLSQSCITGPNARLHLNISQPEMMAAMAGTYSGTITLLLSPN